MRPRHILALLTPLLALAIALPASATPPAPPRLEKTLALGEWRATASLRELPAASPEGDGPSPAQSPSRPTLPELWLRLAYASFNGYDFDIWQLTPSVEPNGTVLNTRRPIVAAEGNDISPRISPDLGSILFSSNRNGDYDLYRVPYEGGEPVFTIGGPGDQLRGAWSPDGRRIAYSSNHEGNFEIYVAQADGSGAARLTNDGAEDGQPSWSPDGRSIIWARWAGESGAVWTMSADGRNQRALTGQLRFLGTPVWSPDGSQIAFDYDADGDGFNQPAVMAANGAGLRALTTAPNPPGNAYDITVGGWSPDGERVIVTVGFYEVSGGRAILDRLWLGRVSLGADGLGLLLTDSVLAYPDGRSSDQQAPVTSLQELPSYKRAGPLEVTLSGSDIGIANIRSYELQARRNGGPWSVVVARELPVISPVMTETLTYNGGSSGDTVELRSRAVDDAGNRELFPASEAMVTLFGGLAAGRITDNRGYPTVATLGLTPAGVGPTAPDATGRYLARTVVTATQTFAPTAPGLKGPPATTLSLLSDRFFDAALLPADDLLGDGGFEAGSLGGWSSAGDLPAPEVVGQAFTGAKALRLGTTCAQPCLGDTTNVTPPISIDSSKLVVGETGVEHLLLNARGNDNSNQLWYTTRAPGDAWSARLMLTSTPGNTAITSVDAVVGAGDVLHIIYETRNFLDRYELFYRTRSAAGVWSAPLSLGPSDQDPRLFGGSNGRVFLLYRCFNPNLCPGGQVGSFSRVLTPGGGWGARQAVSFPYIYNGAVGLDGNLYLTWRNYLEGVALTKLDPSGRQIGSQVVAPAVVNTTESPGIAIDGRGTIHLVWGESVDSRYVTCLAGLECSPPQVLPPALTTSLNAAADRQGVVHIWDGTVYWRRGLDGIFSATTEFPGGPISDFALDGAGRVHIFRERPAQSETTLTAPAAGASTLTRQVNIPATMHRPTLSFAYSLGRVAGGSGMRVLVDDGSGPETVLTRTTPAPWGLAWADLTPYAGKTVTLTIALDQAANAPRAELLLDDVALGSWKTPVLESATPLELSALKPSTLTISGTNFLEGAQVLLGATPVAGVERVGETTLRASVPAGIKPGVYRLTVVNPGGARAAIDGIVVGERRFAPLVVR